MNLVDPLPNEIAGFPDPARFEQNLAMEDVCIWESESGIQAVQLAVVQQLEALGLPVPRGEPDSQPVRAEKGVGNWLIFVDFVSLV